MYRNATISIVVVLITAAMAAAEPGAELSGTVLDGDKRPARSAQVTLYRIANRNDRFKLQVTATVRGEYAFKGLPPGPYRICAQLPDSLSLNPCDWVDETPVALLGRGEVLRNVPVPLIKGVAIPIRIDDPDGVLDAEDKKGGKGAHLAVVASGGRAIFHTAQMVSKGNKVRNYRLVIPPDTTIRLRVGSRSLRMGDAAGKEIERATPALSVRIAKQESAAPPERVFRVLGIRDQPKQ